MVEDNTQRNERPVQPSAAEGFPEQQVPGPGDGQERRIPIDFVARKIQENDSNNAIMFLCMIAASIGLLVIAHWIQVNFYVDGQYLSDIYSNIGGFDDYNKYVEAHWTSLPMFIAHWVALLASLAAWCYAWWQLGNVNALLVGLVVALAGSWAVGMLGGVNVQMGEEIVSIGDVVPIMALQRFFFGMGLGFAGVSLWSYKYKGAVSMWLAYAASVVVLLTGFFAIAAAV